MIDRLAHHAEVLTLTGDSYRTRGRRELLAKDRTDLSAATVFDHELTDRSVHLVGDLGRQSV
jgi:hypothetical protein